VPRVEHEQRHVRDIAASSLQSEPTFKGLTVARPRLGLDSVPPTRTEHDGIPCSSIVWLGEWDLREEPERRVQPRSEPSKERCVCSVSQRLA
jgi:hypothetical protein